MPLLPENRPALMGILNVTPDSFSDGGLHFEAEAAIARGLQMVDEGADVVDVGGESTRPGAEPVSVDEEIRRTIPVIQALAKRGVAVSIDTMKAEVARAAIDAGAVLINNVSGFRDEALSAVASDTACHVCVMHMRGEPRTMQENPTYADVVAEVRDYLLGQASKLEEAGVAREKIWIDPGIGFGKTVDHNLKLLNGLDTLVRTGFPVLIGVSRKSFIGKLLGGLPAEERVEGTLAAQVVAQLKGARCIRAHDVKQARRAIDIAAAIMGSANR